MRFQHQWLWCVASLASFGCNTKKSTNTNRAPIEEVEDDDGDGGVGVGVPIDIIADYPAFYSDDGLVDVHGAIVDGSIGDIETLTIGGQDATLLDGNRYRGTVTLGADEPWQVVDIFVEDSNGRTGTIQVQVARADAVTNPTRTGELGLLAGPDALDQLVRHVGTFIRPDDLAPPAGVVLRETCEGSSAPGVESGEVTEELELSGTASVRTILGDVFTDDEALHVDLQGTEIVWDAEVYKVYDDRRIGTPTEIVLSLQYGDDLPHSPCDALWAPVTRAVEPVDWSVEFSDIPYCFSAQEAAEAVAGFYTDAVPPELDRASCAWAEWLESALASELSGITTEQALTIDRAGLELDLTATPTFAPPVQTAASSIELDGEGLQSRLAPGVVGPVIQATTALGTVELGEDGLSGERFTWSRTSPVPEVTTLAATEAGALRVLPTPVGFRVQVGTDTCTRTGHVIPQPAVLQVTDDADGTRLAVAPSVAGTDVVNSCGLTDDQWNAVMVTVLESAFGSPATWTAASGLLLRGAVTESQATDSIIRVDVSIPEP